jgi:mono/diheme cytochrome c family protein
VAKRGGRPARGAKVTPKRGGKGRRGRSGGVLRRIALAVALVGLGAGGLAAVAWLGLVPGVQWRERPAPIPSGDPTGASPGADPRTPAVAADEPSAADAPADSALTPPADPTPIDDEAISVAADDALAGEAAYRGAGRCASCHGTEGEGVAGLGPSLRDERWLHGGSRAAIRQVVAEGAAPPLGGYSVAMPAYAGQYGAAQLAQLAAYVWTLSHPEAVRADSAPPRPTVPTVPPAPEAPVRRPTVPAP